MVTETCTSATTKATSSKPKAQNRSLRLFAGIVILAVSLIFGSCSFWSPGTLGVCSSDFELFAFNHDLTYILEAIWSRTAKLGLIAKHVEDSQYVVILDAGSTGSRVHIYEFESLAENQSPDTAPKLLSEVFELTRPGLSHYPDDAKSSAESLNPLLRLALQTVPARLHSVTPITLKATAGLRLLGPEKSNRIMQEVESHIIEGFPFPVPSNGVSILDGQDEAVYAWVTANYLLENLNSKSNAVKKTAAVFDLGGASSQIVFEPSNPKNTNLDDAIAWEHGDHRYDLNFGGSNYSLYQHSHLGYGLMEARKKVHSLVLQRYLQTFQGSTVPEKITNPCIAPGLSRTVSIDPTILGLEGDVIQVVMEGPSTASPAECLEVTEAILNIDEPCLSPPCSFNGIHQPSLSESFEGEELYIFSYFYDRTSPLGLPKTFPLSKLRDVIGDVCSGPSHWSLAFRESADDFESLYDELYGRPEWCLDISFMLSMLHSGYGIPLDRNVTIEKKVHGHELGWCLGASLPLLDLTPVLLN